MPTSGNVTIMFLVIDTATNNVLGEYEDRVAAETCRINIVGGSPSLADYIEVVDLSTSVAAHRQRVARRHPGKQTA